MPGKENGTGHVNGRVGPSELVRVNTNGEAKGQEVEAAGQEVGQGNSFQDLMHSAMFGKQKVAISVPGDTFWHGAQGAPVDVGKPPPDILLKCQDSDWYDDIDTPKLSEIDERDDPIVRISWDMSWSDVLDELKAQCGRAVLFEYQTENYIRKYQSSLPLMRGALC